MSVALAMPRPIRSFPRARVESAPREILDAAKVYGRCLKAAHAAWRKHERSDAADPRSTLRAFHDAEDLLHEADRVLTKALADAGLNAVVIEGVCYSNYNRSSSWVADCLCGSIAAVPVERRSRPR
jgi:hypothetical protein